MVAGVEGGRSGPSCARAAELRTQGANGVTDVNVSMLVRVLGWFERVMLTIGNRALAHDAIRETGLARVQFCKHVAMHIC